MAGGGRSPGRRLRPVRAPHEAGPRSPGGVVRGPVWDGPGLPGGPATRRRDDGRGRRAEERDRVYRRRSKPDGQDLVAVQADRGRRSDGRCARGSAWHGRRLGAPVGRASGAPRKGPPGRGVRSRGRRLRAWPRHLTEKPSSPQYRAERIPEVPHTDALLMQ